MPSANYPGGPRKSVHYAGKYYSAAGTAANQTISAGPALVKTIVLSGAGTATFTDGGVAFLVCAAPAVIPWDAETETNVVVNVAATCTVSVSYN